MNYDDWKTTTPEDHAHVGDCHCAHCHDYHIAQNTVVENAIDFRIKCCMTELSEWKSVGKVCDKHPEAYFEPATKEKAAFCEECDLGVKP